MGGVAIGAAAALTPLIAELPRTYLVGAKNFSEQFILAELMSDRLGRQNATTEQRTGLGSAIAFRALANGDIDVYVDYSGTLWTNVMQRRDSPARDAMLRELTEWMAQQYGVRLLGALGFENAYALAMKRERAAALGVHSIEDLARHAPQLTLGTDLEFLSRPEWSTLQDAYDLNFAAKRSYNPTFMYRALEAGDVDVITAFSSDGRIAAHGLELLADPKRAIPFYDALILVSPKRADDPLIARALTPLIGRISVQLMQEANLMVDGDTNKASPKEAARWLARAIGLDR
jgi:osmoprotectant transport system permease protein